ncbi:PEBP-like protein [Auriscalpium vulgare]|uniref:PEBP-like protein n=1 Tax=Auriscalpium vulgare TaxID=40419 RepID=A0ACB8RWR3_9AGAM|nr:PEBP-like protein [Auriscalpium vulgare]
MLSQLTIAFFAFSPVFPLACAQSVTQETIAGVQSAFSNFSIVPQVISTFKPSAILDLAFNDSASNSTLDVSPGENLTIEQTTFEPQFFLTSNSTSSTFVNSTFVIAMVDPDAPTPQNASVAQFRHFLGGNFTLAGPGVNFTLLTNSTPAITEYQTPGPPNGSDPHRYILLVFEQPANFTRLATPLVNASTVRTNFNITVFANMTGLGLPIAGNFFLTGPENSTANGTGTAPAPGPSTASSGVLSVGGGGVGVIGLSLGMAIAGLLL